MRILSLAVGVGVLAVFLARAEEDVTEKTLEKLPLKRMYKIQDEHGQQLTLSQWELDTRYVFVLRDSDTRETMAKLVADKKEDVQAGGKEEEYVMVRPERANEDGTRSPAVFEVRSRRGVQYLLDNKPAVWISTAEPRTVRIGERTYKEAHQRAGITLEKLKDGDPGTAFNAETLAKQKPADEFTLTDAVGRTFALYVWNQEHKWQFVLADGPAIKKKVLGETQETIPAMFKDEEYRVCIKPETFLPGGEKVPAVFETRTRKVCVCPESYEFHGKVAHLVAIRGPKITIGDETYSAVKEKGDTKAVRPPKEGDF